MEVHITIIAHKTPGIRSRVFRVLADYGVLTGNRVTEDDENTTFHVAFQWRDASQAGSAASLLSEIPGIVEVTEVNGPAPELEADSGVMETAAFAQTAPIPPPPQKPSIPIVTWVIGGVLCSLAGVAYVAGPFGTSGRREQTPSAPIQATAPAGIETPVPVEPSAEPAPAPRPAAQQPPGREAVPPPKPQTAATAKPAPFVPPTRGPAGPAEAPVISAPPSVSTAQSTPPAPAANLPRVEQAQPQAPAPPQAETPRPVPQPIAQTPVAPTPAPAPEPVAAANVPKPVRRVEPSIPASMKKALKGDVTVSVKVYVGKNGDVIDTVPMKQGDPAADQIAAVAAAAVRKWQFEPGKVNGEAQASQAIIRIRVSK